MAVVIANVLVIVATGVAVVGFVVVVKYIAVPILLLPIIAEFCLPTS